MFERLEAALNKRLNGHSLVEWLSIGENALMRARLYGMTADWAGKFLPSPLRHAGHALALWRGATAGAALERDRVQQLAHTTIAHSRNQLEQAVLQTYAAIWWELRTPPRALLHAGSPLEQAQAQWRTAIDAEVALFRSATRALQSGSVAPGPKTQPGARP
jgi:hypothetical protein